MTTKRQQHFSVGSARCKKDSAEIVSCMFGEKLNEDMKQLKSVGVLEFFQKGGGGHLFQDGFVLLGQGNELPDAALIGQAPLELFMSGDLLWFHTALGKEGFQSWWCPYCQSFKNDWQGKNHETSPAWTLDLLREQARKIAAGEVKNKVAREVLGVKTVPIFDAVDVDHYVIPVLHLTIGLVNDVLDHLVSECQAAAEVFTQQYYDLEIEQEQVGRDLSLASESLTTFNTEHKQYIINGRKQLRQRRTTMNEEAENLETNLGQLESERTALQKNVDALKIKKQNVEAASRVEGEKPENSNKFGQPVRAFIDDVLRKHSIDRAVQHGGKLEGNQCRKLLSRSAEILFEIREYICSRQQEYRIVGTNEEIEEVFHWHHVLLVALDGLFSGLRTTRYQVNDENINETVQFHDQVLEISRYLGELLSLLFDWLFCFLSHNLLSLSSSTTTGLSITPKLHVVEDHAIPLMIQLSGYGDLGEDFGERAHQSESKLDKRFSAIRDFERKEKVKSKVEMQVSLPLVQIKQEEMIGKTKLRGTDPRVVKANSDKKNNKNKRKADWISILNIEMPVEGSTLPSLTKRRKLKLATTEAPAAAES